MVCTLRSKYSIRMVYGRFGHLWGKISESLEPVPRVQCLIFRHETFTGSPFHQYKGFDLSRILSRHIIFRNLDNYVKSFWLDCEFNKFNMSSLTPELTFSDQNKIDLKFSILKYTFSHIDKILKIVSRFDE